MRAGPDSRTVEWARRLCYKNRMRPPLLLFAICAFAVWPSVAQDQKPAPPLPTVTDFECPTYPPKAKSERVQGMVRLQLKTNGHQVVQIKALPGHPWLVEAAEANVLSWKFAEHTPTTFTVTFFYTFEGKYKRDPATKCDAKLELPATVTVSANKL